MELKTQVHAIDGAQDLTITREFDLAVSLVFKAYTEPVLLEQWMGTKVIKLENKKHGSWQFETSDQQGNVVFKANGAIHDIVLDHKIVRTFEMENATFGVQLEVLTFEPLTEATSKLTIHAIYESGVLRDKMLQLPFKQGINMAHNRLQEKLNNLK